MKTVQIAKETYLRSLKVMKKTLDLLSFKFDKRTTEYKYAKSQVMDYFFDELRKTFKYLADLGIIEKCPCGTNVRRGYKNCICGGSGYVNKKKDK